MDQNIIVNERCRNLRALGRDALRGKWGLAVGGTLLYGVLTTVPAVILNVIFGNGEASSGISSIYSLLISGPMTLGFAMFAISIFRKRDTSVTEVLYGFERFGKALGLYLLIMVLVLLWLFPVYIAIPFYIIVLGNNLFSLLSSPSLTLLPLFALIILCIPAYIAYFRYSMSYYILADNPGIGPFEAINRSKKMMAGNKRKLFCLYLTFIGWAILCCFTLGIGFLWLMPYIEVSIVAFYDIANGSLRSVRKIEGAGEFNEDGSTSRDPITVYRDELETAEPAAPETETAEPAEKETEPPAIESQDSKDN